MVIQWTIAIIKGIQPFHLINLLSQDSQNYQTIIKVSSRKVKIISLLFRKLEEILVIPITEKVKILIQTFVILIRNRLRAAQINMIFNLEIIYLTRINLI